MGRREQRTRSVDKWNEKIPDAATVRKLKQDGFNDTEIAALHNVKQSDIAQVRKDNKIAETNSGFKRGVAKEFSVKKISQLKQAGLSDSEIGKQLGASEYMIGEIRRKNNIPTTANLFSGLRKCRVCADRKGVDEFNGGSGICQDCNEEAYQKKLKALLTRGRRVDSGRRIFYRASE